MILDETILTDISNTENQLNVLYGVFLSIVILLGQRILVWLTTRKGRKAEKEKTDLLVAELATNGGTTSMKDVVNMIKTDVGEIHTAIKSNSEKIAKIEDRIDVIFSRGRAQTELALDQSPIAQFLCDEKGMVTFANDAVAELLGLTKPELVMNKWIRCIDNQTIREDFVRRLKVTLADGYLFTYSDVPIKNQQTGKVVNTKISIEPRLDERGKFIWNICKIRC